MKVLIKNYEAYSIDIDGNIYSSLSNKRLRHILKKNGYKVVNLFNKDKSYQVGVHRLLALAFIPNPFNKNEVNHKDGNKSNNNISNLEWVTSGENNIHALKNGLRRINHGEKHNWCRTTTELQAREVKKLLSEGLNNKSIAEKLNIPSYNVNDIKRGKSWAWIK